MRRIHPTPSSSLSDDDLRAAYAVPEGRRWVRANMVATLDGAIVGGDGRSGSIATPADQRVFSIARLAADVVLVGAGTIRAEDYRPSRRTLAVVTRSLDLPMSLRMFADRTDEHPRPIVLTTADAVERAPADLAEAAELVACGEHTVDVTVALQQLVDRGLNRIHCEGGPALLSAVVAAGHLDELLLTVSPMLLGATSDEHIVRIPGGLRARMPIVEAFEEDGTVLLRCRR